MFTVTLKDLRKEGACFDGYNKVVRMLQGKEFTDEDSFRESYIRFRHDEPISLVDICHNNGIGDALWATRCLVGHDRDLRLLAVAYARQVQNLMKDDRSSHVLDVAERFANGEATQEEFNSARTAARDAADDMWDAAWAAWNALSTAAWAAVCNVSYDVARAASWADDNDVENTAMYEQIAMFIAMCEGRSPWQK